MSERQHSEKEIEQMLSKYLEGSLSNKDQRLLEKYALDDPFLMEAMEGFVQNGTALDKEVLAKLKEEVLIQEKKGERRTSIPYLKWAAAILALAFVGLMGIQLMQKEKPSKLVAESLEPGTSEIQVAEAKETFNTDNIENDEKQVVPIEQEVKQEAEKASPPLQPKAFSKTDLENDQEEAIAETKEIDLRAVTNTAYIVDGVPVTKEEFEGGEVKPEEIPLGFVETRKDLSTRLKEEVVGKKRKAKTKLDKIIAIKVTDAFENPIIGASILAGNEMGLSNLEGYATIQIDSSVRHIQIEYAGYESFKQILSDTTSFYSIQLKEIKALEEVEVSAFNQTEVITAPEGGWNQFELYAEQQLSDLPRTSQRTGRQRGEVIIQFKVKKSGELGEFRVIQSLDSRLDKAVIDMVKSYGKWVTNPPEQETVTEFKYIFH